MQRPVPSRRDLIRLGAGLSALSLLPRSANAMDLRALAPLGFQAHSLRIPLTRDFPGTLRVMKAMGFDMVELACFPGFVGDRRGDFGALGQMPPAEIRRTIDAAGLVTNSCHFLPHQFAPAEFDRSIEWAKGVGITHMIHAGLDIPAQADLETLNRELDLLNQKGARVRAAGLKMGFHPEAHVWRTLGGRSATEETMRRLDPQNVMIQMDFGTIIQVGADGAAILERWPEHFFSVHFRDGKKQEDTYAYLPAAPLGTSDIDWARVIRAAQRAGIKHYVVEMTRYPGGIFDGLKDSHDYLASLKV